MQRLAGRSVWCALVLIVGASLLVCGLAGALAGRAAVDGELAAARSRWAVRPFSRYRLVVDEETLGGGCRQDLQIQDSGSPPSCRTSASESPAGPSRTCSPGPP
ncbi:MAG TPA: hypothetical protein VF897_02415, partial [Roseiflexaceae bacterium]